MANQPLRIYLAATILIAVVGFYVFSHINRDNDRFSGHRGRTVSKFDIPFTRFMGAETLRLASSDELVEEVMRVIAQNGLPADVFVDDTRLPLEERRRRRDLEPPPPLPPNIAITLHDLFYVYYDSTTPENTPEKLALEELWNASPIGEWNIDEQTLDSVRTILARFEPKRQTIRTMLLEQNPRFYFIFIYPETLGAFQDVRVQKNTEASRYLSDYALLEEYAIAQALLDGNIAEAINALAFTFRIAQLASNIGNVAARSDAALVRLRAFNVMQRVILDPNFERIHMVALRSMLSEQYEDWTSEYITWFGDRASGIILYHRILQNGMRDDGLEDILEETVLYELDKHVPRNIFLLGFKTYHEADQTFYLRSMQKILDVSDELFVRRLDVLRQISDELYRMGGMYDEQGIAMDPFVAHMLLKDIEPLMRIFAMDESALHRTLALMHQSLERRNTDHYRDPFTAEPFEVHSEDGLLSILSPPLPRAFRVPVFVGKE